MIGSTRLIGGFFPLHEPDGAASEQSVLARWTGGRQYVSYVNARSAFAALVELLDPKCVWLPAYVCADLVCATWREKVRFYHVGRDLEADVALLNQEAMAGDLVLGIDYFGYPVGPAFLAFTQARRDLLFVEDRAQALDTGSSFWGDWCLYSPRKLLGVADGGILVAAVPGRPIPQCSQQPDAVPLWTAPILRYEDRAETGNEVWYTAHRKKEMRMTASQQKMTELSRWVLSRTSLDPLAERRQRNWAVLREYLGRWLAFDHRGTAAPFGYVIKVPSKWRAALLHALHSERIFAAVQWDSLASAAEEFPAEHDLCSRLVTLPCDHRYDQNAMRHLGLRVAALLAMVGSAGALQLEVGHEYTR